MSTLIGDMAGSIFQLLEIMLLGVVLFLVLRAARFAIDVVPLSAERREGLRRAFPLGAAASVVLYLLVSAGIFFAPYPEDFPTAVAVILGGSIAASWFGLRDVVSGVFVRAGRVVRVGDYVSVGDLQGRVERMGARTVVIQTARGEEAILPYRELTRQAVLRTPVSERGTLHVFELLLPSRPSVAITKRQIREAALRCHWAAIAREPEINVLDADRYEVTVFAIDPDRVREVEAAVRSELAGR